MMEPTAWIALCSLAFLVVATVGGAIFAGFKHVASALDKHEAKDEERHEANVTRLARIETIVLNGHGHGYGFPKPKADISQR